ncbi:MAG: hypothetical protein BWY39_00025 [Spirochaetes bacterium ADurb.Bin269]|nr:MAG: hypothetical protein BWY39_00025 [Spirochaetes bacterium ADurb.Bin269]
MRFQKKLEREKLSFGKVARGENFYIARFVVSDVLCRFAFSSEKHRVYHDCKKYSKPDRDCRDKASSPIPPHIPECHSCHVHGCHLRSIPVISPSCSFTSMRECSITIGS